MLEALLQIPAGAAAGGGSGLNGNPTTLIAGDSNAGFYGETAGSQLITGTALASAIGLGAGSDINSTGGWLKFSWKGKPLYIAKMPFRDSCPWQYIYQCGAVYGDDTVGTYPSGFNRVQDARVTINGVVHRVRLMHMALTATSPHGVRPVAGTEANDLWLAIKANAGGLASYTDAQVGQPTGSYYFSGIESMTGTTTMCLLMNNALQLSNDSKTQGNVNGVHFLWRPVLEPI
jgi:hypothetical protein